MGERDTQSSSAFPEVKAAVGLARPLWVGLGVGCLQESCGLSVPGAAEGLLSAGWV